MRTRIISRMIGMLALVSFLTGSGLAASAAAARAHLRSAALTFTAQADAAVTAKSGSGYSTMNFGASPVLRAQGVPDVRSYLRFQVAGLNGAAVGSAQLRLYATTSSSIAVNAFAASSNTWDEGGISYSNAPGLGTQLGSSPSSFSAGTWVTFDVSSLVTSDGTYSFALTSSGAVPADFASRETGATAPQLVVTQADAGWQPSFPIRAAFYYPWFPQAWKQQGIYPYTNFTPQLGYYSSTDASVLKQHIAMMQYANIQVGIASWWGQGSLTDTRIPGLLSAASGTSFRWSLYYEAESLGDPTPAQIQNDLTYIRDHYAGDPGFLRVNGKFVVFVYSDGNDACGMADRWKQGNTVGAYVVLKVFSGYKNCASQPDSWHQYSPAGAADRQGNYSYSISPGFWLVGQSPRLARDVTRWAQNVRDMVASGTNWQLITTFSEWGEGTAVEPAIEWASPSGYGQYLDALHYNGNTP